MGFLQGVAENIFANLFVWILIIVVGKFLVSSKRGKTIINQFKKK